MGTAFDTPTHFAYAPYGDSWFSERTYHYNLAIVVPEVSISPCVTHLRRLFGHALPYSFLKGKILSTLASKCIVQQLKASTYEDSSILNFVNPDLAFISTLHSVAYGVFPPGVINYRLDRIRLINYEQINASHRPIFSLNLFVDYNSRP